MSKKEQSALTKTRLFETALTLFKQQSYDEVTISQICQAAGVAKGTFYVHYQGKEDIIHDSYYSDMGKFVLQHYQNWLTTNYDATEKAKIKAFLVTELSFTAFAGHEITCRAFVINLSRCIRKESHHFEQRPFTKTLQELILSGCKNKVFSSPQTADELFLYLESFIRGLMASWCFANGTFSIVEVGQRQIKELVDSL